MKTVIKPEVLTYMRCLIAAYVCTLLCAILEVVEGIQKKIKGRNYVPLNLIKYKGLKKPLWEKIINLSKGIAMYKYLVGYSHSQSSYTRMPHTSEIELTTVSPSAPPLFQLEYWDT